MTTDPKLSEVSTTLSEDQLDKLVEKASTPNLASLFRKGKEAGLIQTGKEYGNT